MRSLSALRAGTAPGRPAVKALRPPVVADASVVLDPGPWKHRFVTANGSRFHVADTDPDDDSRRLVLLLHGFPQFWWAWRHILPALHDAGYRGVAMDLRGSGASDKPPRGYDTVTLTRDVAGVIRSLGANDAVIVGQGWGSWVAWSSPAFAARTCVGVVALSSVHPALGYTNLAARGGRARLGRMLSFQVPRVPERALRSGELVEQLLREWSGPGWPSEEEVRRYQEAMLIPRAAYSALESFRWAARSGVRPDGKMFRTQVRTPVDVPALHLHGAEDSAISAELARRSGRVVARSYRFELFPGAGHFLAEEAPEAVTASLLGWLDDLPAT